MHKGVYEAPFTLYSVKQSTFVELMRMYHVWQYNLDRSALLLLKTKPVSRWNQDDEPAVWLTRTAANKWAAERWGRGEYMVLQCRGLDLCGMSYHLADSGTGE